MEQNILFQMMYNTVQKIKQRGETVGKNNLWLPQTPLWKIVKIKINEETEHIERVLFWTVYNVV